MQLNCLLFGHDVVVLFDLGVTYSFVSNECVRRLRLVMRELACKLIVATPASGEVSTTSVCGVPYGGGRPQVQGESHMLADEGS